MLTEKIFLDLLTPDSVSVRKQKYVTLDDVEYTVGEPWRRSYVNSPSGRQQVEDEVPEPYSTAILAVWGDVPTVVDHTAE